MKAVYFIATFFVFVSLGCNQKEKKEIARLSSEMQSLKAESQAKDSSINDILQSLNQIESNLTVIKEKESVISVKSESQKEMSADVRERINEDVMVINELMAKNKKEISRLHKLLKNSNMKIEEFKKMVADLNLKISERDSQIMVMKQDLTRLNFSIETLNKSMDTLKLEKSQLQASIDEKNIAISSTTNSLNSAWYVADTKKQLLTDGVIMKAGGVAGINASLKLKPDFNESRFKKVDIRQFAEIPVNSKKAQLITAHPAGSYQMETNASGIIEKIKITNPEKFWSASKYLVVITN